MRTAARRLLGCCLVPLTVGAVGCGSGGSSVGSPSSGPTGPRASFIAAADRKCAAAHRTLDARPTPTAFNQIVPYLDTTIQVDGELERELRALTPPPQDAASVANLLGDFQDLLNRAMTTRTIAAGGDLAATDQALSDLTLQVATVNAKARRFGFTSCGIAPKPPASASS